MFGALGPDDTYFSSRVQVAARDAQQRWPLLREVALVAAIEPPPLTGQDKENWNPAAPAQAANLSRTPQAKSRLGKQIEAGLSRLGEQTAVDSLRASSRMRSEYKPVARPAAEREDPIGFMAAVELAPQGLASGLGNGIGNGPGFNSAAHAAWNQPVAPAPKPEPLARRAPMPGVNSNSDSRLGSVFSRLAAHASPPIPSGEAARKSPPGYPGRR